MDKITDVVVVGFGGAGAAAAIEAADAGAEVLILEKMRIPGGATNMSGGAVYGAGTSTQRAAGITDTPDEMYKYMMATDSVVRDPAIARVLADESGAAIEWLRRIGVDFRLQLEMAGVEEQFAHITPAKPRAHRPQTASGLGGSTLFAALAAAVRARKIETMLQTTATELITNLEKEVVGVKASSGGKDLLIRARRAMVLADGGFAQNREMVKQFLYIAPYLDSGKIAFASHPGQTGDGIRMAMAIGAGLCGMQACHLVPRLFVRAGRGYPFIFVNGQGQRFVNENLFYNVTSNAIDKQDANAFQIFDDVVRKGAPIPEALARVLVSAPTIGELAAKLGVPVDRLENTVRRWNTHAERGKDPDFGKTGPEVGLIKTPPFWGGEIRRGLMQNWGGLKTNGDAQVLDVLHGKPIPRLYAAGQTTGGRMGVFYPGSGASIANCIVFGRIAGKNAAAESPEG